MLLTVKLDNVGDYDKSSVMILVIETRGRKRNISLLDHDHKPDD